MLAEEKQKQALALLARTFPGCEVTSFTHMQGDASSREFYRIALKNAPRSSVILMLVQDNPGPLGGGEKRLGQDETFVWVAEFLRDRGLPVPVLFAKDLDEGMLLVEDLGRYSFRQFCEGYKDEICEAYEMQLKRADLLEQAVSYICKLQETEYDQRLLPFQRSLSFETYFANAMEFCEHLASPRGLRSPEREVLQKLFEGLCETVRDHPKALCHFDYGAHNLALAPDGMLYLLDFQDCCYESYARDLASLLNDRDMDSLLGEEVQRLGYGAFLKGKGWQENGKEAESFHLHYLQYLLHWDFRVSGRFALLAEKKSRTQYAAWIPGTVRRLHRGLLALEKEFPEVPDAISIVERVCQEFLGPENV